MTTAHVKRAVRVQPYRCDIDHVRRRGVEVARLTDASHAVFHDHLYVWAPYESAAIKNALALLERLYRQRDTDGIWADFLAVYPDQEGYVELHKAKELRQARKDASKQKQPLFHDLPLFRSTGT